MLTFDQSGCDGRLDCHGLHAHRGLLFPHGRRSCLGSVRRLVCLNVDLVGGHHRSVCRGC